MNILKSSLPGWTTVITRSPVGRAIMADARGKAVELYDFSSSPDKPMKVLKTVQEASSRKKKYSEQMHAKLIAGHSA